MSTTSARAPRVEQRDAAREKARALRIQQERQAGRNRRLLIGGVIAFIAVVALAVTAIIVQGNKSLLASVSATPAHSTGEGAVPLGADLVAGATNAGAPVVDVYFDYTCSYCGQFEEINADDLEEATRAGEVTLAMHPVSILDRSGDYSAFSGRAAQAAMVVADGAPEAFLDFHDAMFALWGDAVATGAAEGGNGAGEPTDSDIAAAALEAGVPQGVVDRFAERTYTEWVEASTAQFRRDGFQGTPTVLIDGEPFQGWPEPGALLTEVMGQER
jgi:protein-disulfide isomerase